MKSTTVPPDRTQHINKKDEAATEKQFAVGAALGFLFTIGLVSLVIFIHNRQRKQKRSCHFMQRKTTSTVSTPSPTSSSRRLDNVSGSSVKTVNRNSSGFAGYTTQPVKGVLCNCCPSMIACSHQPDLCCSINEQLHEKNVGCCQYVAGGGHISNELDPSYANSGLITRDRNMAMNPCICQTVSLHWCSVRAPAQVNELEEDSHLEKEKEIPASLRMQLNNISPQSNDLKESWKKTDPAMSLLLSTREREEKQAVMFEECASDCEYDLPVDSLYRRLSKPCQDKEIADHAPDNSADQPIRPSCVGFSIDEKGTVKPSSTGQLLSVQHSVQIGLDDLMAGNGEPCNWYQQSTPFVARSLSRGRYQKSFKVTSSPYQPLIHPHLTGARLSAQGHVPPCRLDFHSLDSKGPCLQNQSDGTLPQNGVRIASASTRQATCSLSESDVCVQRAVTRFMKVRFPLTHIVSSETLYSREASGFVEPVPSNGRKTSAPLPPDRFDSWLRVQRLNSKIRSTSCPNLVAMTVGRNLDRSPTPASTQKACMDTNNCASTASPELLPLAPNSISSHGEARLSEQCLVPGITLQENTSAHTSHEFQDHDYHDYWVLESRSASPTSTEC